MTLDPGLPAPPDTGGGKPAPGGMPDVSTFSPDAPAGSVYAGPGGLTFYFDGISLKPLSTSSTSDKYINLGNGRLFDTTTGQTVDTGGGAGGGANYVHTTERLIDPNQIAVEQSRAANALEIARLQNAVASARNEQEAKYWQGQLENAQRTQQFNEFKYLSDLASNPRNFMQSFFMHRGFQPPANAGQFGNTPAGFNTGGFALPGFLGGGGKPGTPATSGGAGAPSGAPGQFGPGGIPTGTTPGANAQQPSSMLPTSGLRDPNSINATGGSTGYFGPNDVNKPATPAPIQTQGFDPTAQAAAQKAGASYSYSGTPVNPNPGTSQPFFAGGAPAGTSFKDFVTPEQYRLTQEARADARGGEVTPMAQGGVTPEPIMGVGLHSNPQAFAALHQAPGHKYLIGEKGPEGVVPAKYLPKFLQSRHGKTLTHGNVAPGQASGDAFTGTNVGGMSTTYGSGGTLAYGDGGMVGIPQGASGGDLMAMFASGGTLGMPNRAAQAAMRTPLSGSLMDGGAVGVNTDITAMADGGLIGSDVPSDTNPYADSGSSPYDQLSASGDIPPFLSRVMGQAQGDQSVGTNVPQKAYLPPGLPLVSSYAYGQMSPSEQQALQSYASSFGVDPQDYLAQMNQQVAPARHRQRIDYSAQ